MASMELNKAFAAVLTAGIAFMLAGQVGSVLVSPERPHGSAIRIGDPSAGAPTPVTAPAAEAEPINGLLASANVENGQAISQRQCGACHSFNEGGRNGVGPNLYNVVGEPHGRTEGYAYSAVLKGKPGPWTYEALNAWLYKPSAYAPGTRMAYAGITNTQQRADVIAYLRSLDGSPEPLPPAGPPAGAPAAQPAAAPAAGAAPAPAGGATPAAPANEAGIGARLASADAAAGEALTKQQCGICHTLNEGGRAGIGPNLYNIVGSDHGHMQGYTYSPALKGKQGPWTYDALDAWLTKPATYAPGTRMAYVGLTNPQQRANVIAYLRSLAAEPKPLP